MAFIDYWSGITGSFTSLIDLISEIVPDKDLANKLKAELATVELQLKHAIRLAMVSARWAYPLTMISGISIVAICVFDLACAVAGWSHYRVAWAEEPFLVLMGMFVFTASGSAELLMRIVTAILEKKNEAKAKEKGR